MAASVEIGDSLEGLEELFLQDITDDFFDFGKVFFIVIIASLLNTG